jgi:alcohol dehydrogenase
MSPVGVIEKLGRNVQGYEEGQRVITGAICPSGYSNACLDGLHSQDGQDSRHGLKPMGGWRFGNTIVVRRRSTSWCRTRWQISL